MRRQLRRSRPMGALAIAALVLTGCTVTVSGHNVALPVAPNSNLSVVGDSHGNFDQTVKNSIDDVLTFWRKQYPSISNGKQLPELKGKLYSVDGAHPSNEVKQNGCLRKAGTDAVIDNAFYCRTIRVYFIKPSRYDDNGYVQFFRYGVQPNNTLTVLAALKDTFNKRYSAERNVYLQTVLWDEICDARYPGNHRGNQGKGARGRCRTARRVFRLQSRPVPAWPRPRIAVDCAGPAHDDGRVPRQRLSLVGREFPQQLWHHHHRGRSQEPVGQIIEDFLRGELQLDYSLTEGIRAKTRQQDIIVPLITEAQLP